MRDSKYDDTTLKLSLTTALRTNGTANGTAVDSACSWTEYGSLVGVPVTLGDERGDA